jgi:hypothetical protein
MKYRLLISYGLLVRIFSYQPTVDKTIRVINQLLIEEGLWMIVDKVWKITNTVSLRRVPRSSHTQRQTTFPDKCVLMFSPCHVVSDCENYFVFS